MSQIKLSHFLDSAYTSLSTPADLTQELISTQQLSLQKLTSSIYSQAIHFNPAPIDITDTLASLRQQVNFDIEEHIKQEQLQEAKRRKEELALKLEEVDSSINSLQAQVPEAKPTKVKLLSSETRKYVYEEEEKKQQEAAMFSKKLMEEQRLLERKRAKKIEEMREEEEKYQKELEARKLQEQEILLKRKEQRLQDLQQQVLKRKQYFEDMKSITQPKPKNPSRSDFKTPPSVNSQAPRTDYSPSPPRKHQSFLHRKDRKTQGESMVSLMPFKPHTQSYFYDVVGEKKKQKELEVLKTKELAELQDRRKRYAAMVKEIHAPVVDIHKKKELELRQARLRTVPRISKPIEKPTRTKSVNTSLTKPKPPPMPPDSPTLPTKRSVDYLDLVRQKRKETEVNIRQKNYLRYANESIQEDLGNTSVEESQKLTKFLGKAKRIEREAYLRAKILQVGNETDIERLEIEDEYDTAILGSVRAKLTLLKQS